MYLFTTDGAMVCADEDLQIAEFIQGETLIIAEDFKEYLNRETASLPSSPVKAKRKLYELGNVGISPNKHTRTPNIKSPKSSPVRKTSVLSPVRRSPRRSPEFSKSEEFAQIRRSPRRSPGTSKLIGEVSPGRRFVCSPPVRRSPRKSPGRESPSTSSSSFSSPESSPVSRYNIELPEFSPFVRKALRDGESSGQITKMVSILMHA